MSILATLNVKTTLVPVPKCAVQTFAVPSPVLTSTNIWIKTKAVPIANMARIATVNMAALEAIVAIINAMQMRNVKDKNVSGFNFLTAGILMK